jgi:hypothetical protein
MPSHLFPPAFPPLPPKGPGYPPKLTLPQRCQVCERAALGATYRQLAAEFGDWQGGWHPVLEAEEIRQFVCDALEAIAKEKGGIGQMMYDKWCKVYKVLLS